MLKELAIHLRKHLDIFYSISYKTGATKADSWVDIEGGIGNLFANASLRRKFPDEIFCIDGESHNLSKNNTFMGTHILIPKEGVAIHILSLIHISEPTRLLSISYAVFCLKKKKRGAEQG